jgi:hypothetical protein
VEKSRLEQQVEAMEAVMAFWNHLAVMLRRPYNSLSKVPQGGRKARKTCSFEVDNKSAHRKEGEKVFSKNEGTKPECL